MDNQQPNTKQQSKTTIKKIHDYDTYSFIYTHDQVFDCLRQMKEYMIESIGVLTLLSDRIYAEHRHTQLNFYMLMERMNELILYKQKAIAPWLDYTEEQLLAKDDVKGAKALVGKTVEEYRKKKVPLL
jgi:hypothetical protein